MLLATNTCIGEQLLNVEKSAWHTVDRVLAVTVPEQHTSHRDLGELQREESC